MGDFSLGKKRINPSREFGFNCVFLVGMMVETKESLGEWLSGKKKKKKGVFRMNRRNG